MLRLTKFCLFSFIVAIIEITWSAFDLVEEAVVFFFNSNAVGKFFIKADRRALISLAETKDEQLTKSEFFYWLLLLVVIIVNCIWVVAAFKLMYGIIKVIFQDNRLRCIKCCHFWFQFSWLLLIIFGVKIFRNSSGFATFVSAFAVVLYRGVSMYVVHFFAKELEMAELLDPSPMIIVPATSSSGNMGLGGQLNFGTGAGQGKGGQQKSGPGPGPGSASGFGTGGPLSGNTAAPGTGTGGQQFPNFSPAVPGAGDTARNTPYEQQPMTVFDVHRV